MDIFIDESGDLGFSSRSSHYFVAAYVIPDNAVLIRSRLSKLLRKMHRNKKYSGSELKFSDTNHDTRLWVLDKLLDLDWVTGVVVLEKRKVKLDLRNKPNILYNYAIVHNVMNRVMMLTHDSEHISICIDKSLSRLNRGTFDTYAQDKASYVWNGANHTASLKPGQVSLRHEDSYNDPCIQLADFVSGSVFQKHERGNDEYYRVIEDRIAYSHYLW